MDTLIENIIIFILIILLILMSVDISFPTQSVLPVVVLNNGIQFSNSELSLSDFIDTQIKNIFTSVGYTLPSPDGVVGSLSKLEIGGLKKGQVVTYTLNGVEKTVVSDGGSIQINEIGVVKNLSV